METYEVSRKLLSLGPTYLVRAPGSDDVLLTIKGAMVSRKLTLHEGNAEGPELAVMAPNFFGTKWEIVTPKKETLCRLSFPAIALKKSFTIELGGKEYKADGGFVAVGFKCNDLEGQPLLDVSWELSWTDKFVVKCAAPLTREIATLATAAIHQKFYTE
jgi:hypothetical protein